MLYSKVSLFLRVAIMIGSILLLVLLGELQSSYSNLALWAPLRLVITSLLPYVLLLSRAFLIFLMLLFSLKLILS